jgi:glycosyltransferase involved in cell wall biosynthesis
MRSSGKSVVFVINSLTSGGAERAMIHLLACMEDRLGGTDTHLVLLDCEEERHRAPPWVHKHVLDAHYNLTASITLLTSLLRELSPAVVLSFLNRANCANVVAARILGYPCIISERVHTTSHFATGLVAAINKGIVRLTYRFADHVIAVSDGIRNDLIANYAVPEHKIQVIHNPIDTDQIRKQAEVDPAVCLPDQYILGSGRLVPNKNFRLLIEAYRASGIAKKLVIMGEGSGREELEGLIATLGLQDRVILTGYVKNPFPIIKAARLFVSSSNAEGFPNALVEAMALGCPVVATDCDTGPLEILTGQTTARCSQLTLGKYGILVPVNSVDCLAEAIRTVCRAEIGSLYSHRGRRRAEEFGVRSSVQQYWSTIGSYACSGRT